MLYNVSVEDLRDNTLESWSMAIKYGNSILDRKATLDHCLS